MTGAVLPDKPTLRTSFALGVSKNILMVTQHKKAFGNHQDG